MKPRIDVITIAVEDLERSLRFYREGLGLESDGVVAGEFLETEENAPGALVMFKLEGGLLLCLYPRGALAKDAAIARSRAIPGEFSLGHIVPSREEVDVLLRKAESCGATITEPPRDRPWGIYSGYFRDPDGHLWEVIWNSESEEK